MTVSMRPMTAGTGYEYLLKSVVAGDGTRSLSTPLTRYYAEAGTPPGRWMGSGLGSFGAGEMSAGSEVTESQLALLLGLGRDPVNGVQLGLAYPSAKDTAGGSDRSRAIAGFDLTFSVPKSVSALWGVSDAPAQALIVEAHHAAVAEVLAFFEREVAATRSGATGQGSAVAQVEVGGVAAAAFDHWDSRLGDPQLHTHVVISNKVKTWFDGKWRSLDGRPVYAATVALSEFYDAVLADRLSGMLGLGWERRERGKDRSDQWELAGVKDGLLDEFSGRTRAIEAEKERLIDEYRANRGRNPSRATVLKLRAQATLATRPEKQIRSLADLSSEWRARASRVLGGDAAVWARSIVVGCAAPSIRVDDLPLDLIDQIALAVVDGVAQKRSTWGHWNLWAEASRQTMPWRFATAEDREAAVGLVVDAAERMSVALTPPELAVSPAEFRRSDGTSVFRPKHSTVFSSVATLDAEARLLARSECTDASRVSESIVERVSKIPIDGFSLSIEQRDALKTVASSGRRIDLLVGPAGTGKTTAMQALRAAWLIEHGVGSVVGLAPSAAAADVLSSDLGIECENTAKWLHEHAAGRAFFRRDQLVIIDEATLASTAVLDELTALADAAGAKVLLVGDWAQLQSVDAGGAFALLAEARDTVPELTEIHRFKHGWERTASRLLREGRTEVITDYARHGRIREGTTEAMIDAAYEAWRGDVRSGLASVLVTDSSRLVRELNTRARAERILLDSPSDGRETELADGQVSAGDLIITRRNDRRLRSRTGRWVRNGDKWIVQRVRSDGGLVVRPEDARGGRVVLPAEYVRLHVDLGYAITAHRAQGLTVDTSHVVASGSTTRENFYVAMTRGRASNVAYVALDNPDDSHTTPEPNEVTAESVLFGVLNRSGAELSAHQKLRAEQECWASTAQLMAEYETLASAAQHDRWVGLLRESGLTGEQVEAAAASSAFGPLKAALRRAEAQGWEVERLLPQVVRQHQLDDAEDLAAVIHHRLGVVAGASVRLRPDRSICGLLAEAREPMAEEMREALDQRRRLIEARVDGLVQEAVRSRASWLSRLGSPSDLMTQREWQQAVTVFAAYRDRYGVNTADPLGPAPSARAQRADRAVAADALRRAESLAALDGNSAARNPMHAGVWM